MGAIIVIQRREVLLKSFTVGNEAFTHCFKRAFDISNPFSLRFFQVGFG